MEIWGFVNKNLELPKLKSLCKKTEKKISYVQMHYRAQFCTEIIRLSAGYGALRISTDNGISIFWRANGIKVDDRRAPVKIAPDNQSPR